MATLKGLIERAMLRLGNSEKDVAATLTRAGIKGVPDIPWQCPIAAYLRKELHLKSYEPMVTPDAIFLAALDSENDIEVWTTTAVRSFVIAFDRREYPHLRTNQLGFCRS